MKILLYATNEPAIQNIISATTNSIHSCEVLTCMSFLELQANLQDIYSYPVVVLCVANKEELLELLTVQKILKNSKVVLVLPHSSDELIKQSLNLYPRFITYADQSFKNISVVLNNICTKSSSAFA